MRPPRRLPRGFTLVELMIAVVVVGVIGVIAVPSIKRFMDGQRLRSIAAQVVTDLQFARAEAASRGEWVRVAMSSNADRTCYTLYTSSVATDGCDCLLGQGSACPSADTTREIRTVVVPRSLNVTVTPGQTRSSFAFDHRTGGLATNPTDSIPAPLNSFTIVSQIDSSRRLNTVLNRAGRVSLCAPTGSTVQEVAC